MSELRVFKIDEGIDHWVIAHDEADAKALVLEEQYGGESQEAWDDVEVIAVADAELRVLTFYDDGGETRTMAEEVARDMRRRYVACSEW